MNAGNGRLSFGKLPELERLETGKKGIEIMPRRRCVAIVFHENKTEWGIVVCTLPQELDELSAGPISRRVSPDSGSNASLQSFPGSDYC